jgi:hypothetical protein
MLDMFHANKQSILDSGAQRGKGNRVIDNWHILKLELTQSFVPSIRQLGVAIQWLADITEHTHISEIKTPTSASNNNNYNPQICRYLDQAEKCCTFELATTLCRKELSASSHNLAKLDGSDSECEGLDVAEEDSVPGSSTPTTSLFCPTIDYFAISSCLREKEP